jgi:hypothetical protein
MKLIIRQYIIILLICHVFTETTIVFEEGTISFTVEYIDNNDNNNTEKRISINFNCGHGDIKISDLDNLFFHYLFSVYENQSLVVLRLGESGTMPCTFTLSAGTNIIELQTFFKLIESKFTMEQLEKFLKEMKKIYNQFLIDGDRVFSPLLNGENKTTLRFSENNGKIDLLHIRGGRFTVAEDTFQNYMIKTNGKVVVHLLVKNEQDKNILYKINAKNKIVLKRLMMLTQTTKFLFQREDDPRMSEEGTRERVEKYIQNIQTPFKTKHLTRKLS